MKNIKIWFATTSLLLKDSFKSKKDKTIQPEQKIEQLTTETSYALREEYANIRLPSRIFGSFVIMCSCFICRFWAGIIQT